jgi:hypothetical protein
VTTTAGARNGLAGDNASTGSAGAGGGGLGAGGGGTGAGGGGMTGAGATSAGAGATSARAGGEGAAAGGGGGGGGASGSTSTGLPLVRISGREGVGDGVGGGGADGGASGFSPVEASSIADDSIDRHTRALSCVALKRPVELGSSTPPATPFSTRAPGLLGIVTLLHTSWSSPPRAGFPSTPRSMGAHLNRARLCGCLDGAPCTWWSLARPREASSQPAKPSIDRAEGSAISFAARATPDT